MKKLIISTGLIFLLPLSHEHPIVAQEVVEETAAEQNGEEEVGVIATVNGEPIYYEDLERLLGDLHSGSAEAQRGAPDLDRMVFRLVNDRRLSQ